MSLFAKISARPLLAAALTAFCLPIPAALAETITVTGIEVTGEGGFKLTVPTVEMEDSSLSEAAVRAIFAGDFVGTAGELTELDATGIRIPEIRLAYDIPGPDGALQQSEVIYRDLELLDVTDGVAGSTAVGGAVITAGGGVTITFGPMSSGMFDIGGLLGFYGLGNRTGSQEMKPLYADFVFDGMQIASPEGNCEFGAVRVAEFSARPVATPLTEILPLLQQFEALDKSGEKPDPEAIAKVVGYYLDLLTAYKSGRGEFDGFTCSGKNTDGKPMQITSGPMTMDGFEPGTYPAIAINDFRIDVENDGWMEFGNLTLKSMDFNGAIATLREAASRLDEAWFAANWRKLVPALDGLSASGFGMDIPDPESPDERIQASVGAFDVSLGDYVNGIPATIGLSASDIEIAVPADAEQLVALGLDTLDLSYDVALHWDQAAGDIILDRFAVSGGNLGSIRLSGTLGNATEDLFSDDIEKATAASMGLTLKTLEVDVADEGITNLLIALAAKEQDQEPAAFRAVLSGLAQALPLAALGPNQAAMMLGAELRAFVDGKPNLKLVVTSKDPAGIGLAELEAAQQDPSVLGGKVTIVAEASGEPRPLVAPEPPPAPQTDTGAADAPEVSPRAAEKLDGKQAALAM